MAVRIGHAPLTLALCASVAACTPSRTGSAPYPADLRSHAPAIDSHAIADHTCALNEAGAVYCWGRNHRGQLGAGDTMPAPAPVRVPLDTAAVDLGIGAHSCAVLATGYAVCWGPNRSGQLGDGSHADRSLPVAVRGGLRLTQISAGGRHSCGLSGTGNAYCWGENHSGQLGNGTRSSSPVPVPVGAGDARFSAISAGDLHTCALSRQGDVFCWGDNFLGQLGVPTAEASATPRRVPDVPPLSGIDAGRNHTCGYDQDGFAWCWGQNGIGQLGTGAAPAVSGPERVQDLARVTSIQTGYHHTCAATTDGEVYCWGANAPSVPQGGTSSGQLGREVSWANLPLRLPAMPPVRELAAGDAHTCALTTHGTVLCWGSNAHRQRTGGAGPTDSAPAPVLDLAN